MGGAIPPFFMAITIKVDGTEISMDWQAQQTSNPMDEVDLFVLSDDLTESYPTSAPKKEEEAEGGDEAAKKAKTKSSKKKDD